MKNVYLISTVCLTAYFQLILRWRMSQLGALPNGLQDKFIFIFKSCFDPFILSAYTAAVLASMCWMATLTRLELSSAYPIFLSLTILLIVGLSSLLLHESISVSKAIGVLLIFGGLVFVNQI